MWHEAGTSWAEYARFPTEPTEPLTTLLTTDRNLVDDLAVSCGHHDVRRLYGAPLVAVVGPPDVRDERGLLDAEKRAFLGGRLPGFRLLHGVADGDPDRGHAV